MLTLYLGFNAAIFLALGLWCAVAVDRSATTVGYTSLNHSGRCEFMTVYGGLQVALGILFALSVYNPQYRVLGLAFAIVIYSGIGLFRLIGVVRYWPVTGATLGFATLELAMLGLGVLLWSQLT